MMKVPIGIRVVLLGGCLVAILLWVHGRALGVFFTSPDDLVHLQQAAGLQPTGRSPFRWLSQVAYFRLMYSVFGASPYPYHLVTMAVHAANALLFFALLSRLAVPVPIRIGATATFAVHPLTSTLLSSAVGINDALALSFAMVGILLASCKGWLRLTSGVAFLVALFCKESVLGLPLLCMWFPRGGSPRCRLASVAPSLVIACFVAALFIYLRHYGLAPDTRVYPMAFDSNVFHNLMTYTSWAVNVVDPLPDLVSSFDTQAWLIGLPVILLALGVGLGLGRGNTVVSFGLAWWLFGLLPVLLLTTQTYRHYMYAALPGIALVVSTMVVLLMRKVWPSRSSASYLAPGVASVLVVVLMCYVGNAGRLVALRYSARVPGSSLALDAVNRRREVAQSAIASLGQNLLPGDSLIAVIEPRGVGAVYGARSGRRFDGSSSGQGYSLLEASLDGGRAVPLFFPFVREFRFVDRWSDALRDYAVLIPVGPGELKRLGQGAIGVESAGMLMLRLGWNQQAEILLGSAADSYPEQTSLELGRSIALSRLGRRGDAMQLLRELARGSEADSTAQMARELLSRAREDSIENGF